MDIVSTKDTYDYFNEKYNTCEIRYGDMKKQLAEDINNFCAPIRERILDIRANEEYMEKVARMGAEKASASAAKTLAEVREIIGFRPYWYCLQKDRKRGRFERGDLFLFIKYVIKKLNFYLIVGKTALLCGE